MSRFGVELARLERRIRDLERGRRLANASLDGTALPVYDADGTLRQVVGVQDDGTYTVTDHNAPPPAVPSQPAVSPGLLSLAIAWDGLSATGEPWPADFSHVEVHVSTVTGYTPTDATQVASLHSRLGGSVTLSALEPEVNYYVVLVAVNTSRVESAPTPEIAAAPQAAVTQVDIDGKNSVFYNNVTTGDPVPAAKAVGDFWFKPDEGYKGYHWTGTSWDPIRFGAPALAADSVTPEQIKAGAVGTPELADLTAAPTVAGDPLTTSKYVQSRGMNLVTNGTALLGTNYNFSGLTLVKTDSPSGAGSFQSDTANQSVTTDEFLPVDPAKTYTYAFQGKQRGTSTDGRAYAVVAEFDVDRKKVEPQNIMWFSGTLTTLAADLTPGATTVSLTSAANWKNAQGAATHQRSLIAWNYVDGQGKAWPAQTYSRNVWLNLWDDGAVNFTTNTITLRAAWSGPTIPAGTQVSNGSSGGTYKYIVSNLSNHAIPTSWTSYRGQIGGVDTTGLWQTRLFSPATAYAKVGWLTNRNPTSPYNDVNSRHAFGAVWFSEVSADNLTDGSVVGTKLAPQAVTTDKIADFAIAARKLNTSTHFIY